MRHFISAIFNFILLTFILTSCSCLAPGKQLSNLNDQKPQYVNEVLHLEESTVALMYSVPNDENNMEYRTICAGTMISPKLIISARHCAGPLVQNPIIAQLFPNEKPDFSKAVGMQIAFKTFDQKDQSFIEGKDTNPYFATIKAVGTDDDILLLEMNDEFVHDYVLVGNLLPEIGSETQIVGHEGGLDYTYLVGIVSAIRTDGSNKMIQISAPIWFGDSGGGAFQGNHLVGICSKLNGEVPNVGYFVPTDRIHKFLSELNN